MPTGSYIPSPSASTAIYGQNSPAVGKLQTQLNEQNAGKPGYVPLAVDNRYGPLTLAASKFGQPGPVAVDSGPSRISAAKDTASLNAELNKLGNSQNQPITPVDNTQDPVITQLSQMHASSDATTKALLASTMASYQNQKNSVNKSYDNYKAGLESLGIEHNAAQGTPDLLAGQITEVANEQIGKIGAIDANMTKALMNAKTASENNDFKTLNAEMSRYKELQTEKQNSIKSMYDSITQTKTMDADLAEVAYGTMQNHPEWSDQDKENYLAAVAQKYGLPVDGVVQAFNDFSNTEKGKALTLAKKQTSGSGKKTGTLSNAISTFTDKMEEIKGDDGYIDPYQWVNARTEWLKMGKSATSFNSNFKSYLNPESYSIAGFKTTKSTGGSSGSQTP